MTKYNEIEIQTAENLLKKGHKWIARDESECLFAYTDKPSKLNTFWCSDGNSDCVCYCVPIFQNVKFEDSEPTSLDSIVHPQILDDAERRYLSAVIRPFRDKVMSIKKSRGLYASHYFDEISVYYESFGHDLCFDLPPFKKGAMYKGMEPGREYTLDELGL